MPEGTFSEYGKIEALRLLSEGSGFDCNGRISFSPAGGSIVHNASRVFIEGMDFDLVYFPLKHLGYKCVVAVTGELYASLAHPRLLSIRLGISAKLDFAQVKEIWSGAASAAREHGYTSVDLDLVPSPNGLTLSVSATGEELKLTHGRRLAPRSKDLLCVSGSLGAAYLGQQILEREKHNFEKTGDNSYQPDLEKYRMLVGSYLKPELNASTLLHLEDSGIYPSSGYLVSHGLSDALKRIVRDTGLGAKVYADKIPFEGNSFSSGREMDIDPVSAAMNGGDDFRLLFIVPILSADRFRRDFQTFDVIGHLARPEVGAVLVTPDGVELPVKAQGWKEEED
ncbi:MAG: thiamine-monophosphate kinase [Candidatus Cryptobacteroides sp.]